MPEVVVVGVDGSDNSWHALEWAVGEAKLRGATLKIVCAVEDPSSTIGLGTAFGVGAPMTVDPELFEHAAKNIGEEAASRVKDVPVTIVAKSDRPGDVLCEESASASLLVVGSRGHSAIGSLLLGSVSNFVVHHSTCPVVVVPPPA
jgi:nucleotide-binding universal stress UspA family protein